MDSLEKLAKKYDTAGYQSEDVIDPRIQNK
jgi:hypothetical protein